MKRIFLLIAILPISLMLAAQYYAYSCNGKVQVMRQGQWQEVFTGMELQETDLLQTEEYGKVVMIDRTNSKLYTIQSSEAKPIGTLISNLQQKTPKLFVEYVQGIFNKMLGVEEKQTDGFDTEGGVTYRGEDENRAVALGLLNQHRSQYPLSMLLLDNQTMQPVRNVREGQTVIVQVNNLSDTPLYINVIDIDSEGNKAAIFPADEHQTMLNLYIPALSNIRLYAYPIAFSPGNTIERLQLIAYPLPFDLPKVLKLIGQPEELKRYTLNEKERIGLFSTTVEVLP